jgi:hypothetical protein
MLMNHLGTLNKSSHRWKPVSSALIFLDFGFRV